MTKDTLAAFFADCCSTSRGGALKWRLWVFSVGVLLLLPVAAAQTGFISIDCGSTSNYTDERGIDWSTDDRFVGTGTNVKVTLPQYQLDNGQQLSTARYFQSGRKRYCYLFPDVTNNASYLIRASFLYSDLASPLPAGYSFNLAIDSGIVGHIEIGVDDTNTLVTMEYFVAARSDEITFCLLPFKGNPFISSLELRPLRPETYTGYVFSSQYGVLAQRLNCGATSTDPAIRFPDDTFDRVWETPSASYSIPSVNTDSNWALGDHYAFDLPPLAVMQSAWEASDFWFPVPFAVDQKYYAALYFAEIRNIVATDHTIMDIFRNGNIWFSNLTLFNDGTAKEIFHRSDTYTAPESILNFTLVADKDSTLPALLNGFEVHAVLDANIKATASFDSQALDDLRHSFNLMEWTGDPCFPVPWDWLNCTNEDPAVVTQIKLSNYQLRGTIPPSLGALPALTDLWLDNNFISGSIPDLSGSTKLRTLHLQNNSLTGAIPATLADISLLTELFLQDNDFNGTVPAALLNKKGLNLRVDDSNSTGASAPGSKSGSKGGSLGPIIGAIAGGAVVVFLLVGAFLYCLRMKKKNATSKKQANETSDQKGPQIVFPVDKDGIVQNIKAFPLAEVNRITNNFEKKIGEGGFGPVFFGKLDDGTEVAVKVNSERSGQGQTEFHTEVSLLSRIHHRNLVRLIGFCDQSNKRILIYEFMKGGMLREHLYGRDQRNVVDWPTRLQIAIDAARGLEYLHYDCQPRIIHRDVKSNNILLDENLQAKMIDFGISKSHEEDTTSDFSTAVKGTTGYLDPEYYSTNKLTYKSDVYAFGVVLLEIMSGRAPINNKLVDQRQWLLVHYARQMLSESRLEMIVDRALGHNYEKQAMWKVAELAMRCVNPRSGPRPDMREVVKELLEASQYERGVDSVTSSYSTRDIDPRHHKPSSATAFPSNPEHVRENSAMASWSLPAPR